MRLDPRRTARSAARIAAAGVVVIGTTLLASAPAYADSAQPPAVTTNWYWAEAAPAVEGNAIPVPVPAPASGVPDGDLGVSYLASQTNTPDKIAAVAFDITTVPVGSTFTLFEMTAPLDPAAQQVTNGAPELFACEAIDAFADATGPSDLAKAPPISTPSCVKGVFKPTAGAAGSYVFSLTSMANDWSFGAPSYGVVLRSSPDVAPAQPFSLSLLGKNSITTKAEYFPPTPATPVTNVPPVVTPPVVAPPPAVVPGGVALPPTVPVVEQPAPVTQPVVPQPQANPAPVAEVAPAAAVGYVPGATPPSTLWWLALLGVLVLLGLTSHVLNDPMAPVVVDSRRRRFADVVKARSQGAAAPSSARSSAPRIRPA